MGGKRRREENLEKKMKKKAFRKREKEIIWKEKKLEYEEKIKKDKEMKDRLWKIERKYWTQVNESGYFDIDHVRRTHIEAMKVFKCKSNDDCPLLVQLYARLGLHRYNLIQGTNFQLQAVEKYNTYRPRDYGPNSYYITLAATSCQAISMTFQTCIADTTWSGMNLKCFVARPKDTGRTKGKLWDDKTAPILSHCKVSNWYSDDALADKERFYLVKESEWEENDWIRLYLELVYLSNNRGVPNLKLPDLRITEVVLETQGDVNEILKGFRDANVYVKYDQYSSEGLEVCKRRAVFTRCVDLRSERLRLVGNDYPETELTRFVDLRSERLSNESVLKRCVNLRSERRFKLTGNDSVEQTMSER